MADCSLNAPNPQEEAATERLSHFPKVTLLSKVGLEFLTTPQILPCLMPHFSHLWYGDADRPTHGGAVSSHCITIQKARRLGPGTQSTVDEKVCFLSPICPHFKGEKTGGPERLSPAGSHQRWTVIRLGTT